MRYLSSLQSYFHRYNGLAIQDQQFKELRVFEEIPQAPKGRVTISTHLRLGDLLIRAKLVTEQDVAKALQRLSLCGGRLGENLVAIGALTKDQLEKFLHRTPREPDSIAATGLDEADLLALLLKLMYVNRLQTVRQFACSLIRGSSSRQVRH